MADLAMPELTVTADLVWRVAAVEAGRAGARLLGVDHLLLGLLSLDKLLEPSAGLEPERRDLVRQDHEAIEELLAQFGQEPVALRRAVRRSIRRERGPATAAREASIQRDAACRAVFARASMLARDLGNVRCGALHLLTSILEAPPPSLVAALPSQSGADGPGSSPSERLRGWAMSRITPTPPVSEALPAGTRAEVPVLAPQPAPPDLPSDLEPPPSPPAGEHERSVPSAPSAEPASAPVPAVLLQYGRDLTAEAEAGRLGPVVGRRDEMLQMVRVLHRRVKNSPVLIGEAGVGKTAVVEGLACGIVEGTALPGRRIVTLSLASVLAGATYRGQFEERLEEILSALRGRPDIILFLDELHTIVGAGDQDGRLDAANILKPALARGEIACIGATTTDEYLRHIASDPALERRFQPVTVLEPSPAEARAILDGLRSELERHHAVNIEPAALHAAVDLTVRYVPGRRLPDKAVDALDEACARVSIPSLSYVTDPARLAQSSEAPQAAQSADPEDRVVPVVTRATVAAVVSAWTGIPLGRIGQVEADRLADLDMRLAERVVGQSEAIRQVAARVRLARAGLTDPDRPAGVFLFLGPSGVGKTELVRALADTAIDGLQRLIRLDMSEYREQHAAARLIGAPPGYQGHGDEGQLTGPLRRSPYAIVLLDEAEKAHPDVFDLFLQLFDAGRLTDSSGRLVDGRQAIFVLTSNLVGEAPGRRPLGFGGPGGSSDPGGGGAAGSAGFGDLAGAASASGAGREALLPELRQFFRPELLNRIDEIVLFRPLGASELTEIADRRLSALQQRLMEQQGVEFAVASPVSGFLARRAAAGSGGARELQRIITRLIETPLSHLLLAVELVRGERLIADVDATGDSIVLVRDTRTA